MIPIVTKLWALIKVLGHAKGERLNIYTDSEAYLGPYRSTGPFTRERTTYNRAGAEGTGYKEQGRNPPAAGSSLGTVPGGSHPLWGPGGDPDSVIRGNRLADQAAREVAERQGSPLPLPGS